MRNKLFTRLLGFVLFGLSNMAFAFTELTDEQLDRVTAGTAAVQVEGEWVKFEFRTASRRGRFVTGNGTLSLKNSALPNNIGSLLLRDNAQGNLSALVNVNAVNSLIQVLLNLNINVNSKVGTLRQFNLSVRPPLR